MDWTNKEDVQANIRATVKRLLKRNGAKDVEDLENIINYGGGDMADIKYVGNQQKITVKKIARSLVSKD